jgi:hypothetical protein
MRSQSPTVVLDVQVFDRRAVELKLTRRADGKTVPSNSKIARRLGVSQSTVSRARAGYGVGPEFMTAVMRGFTFLYHDVFRERVAA